MPDTFDLDRAFENLTRDVTTSSMPRGAERAITASRRRRATGAGIIVLAFLTTGGLALSDVGSDGDGPVPLAPDVPVIITPAPLTAAALGEATAGWVGPWTEASAPLLTDAPCLRAGSAQPVADEATEFRAGTTAGASRVYSRWSNPDQAAEVAATIATGFANCQDGAMAPTRLDIGDAQITAYAFPQSADPAGVIWVAVVDDRVGLLTVVGPDNQPRAALQQTVAEALVSGLVYNEDD
jgi:hypothetical protein